MIDVTVIVPVYNVEKYLRRCLDSLIKQDYDKTKIELYIIDDCSTDESAKIIKEYEIKYPFITAKYLQENFGVSYARNLGIRECKGEYIMFCDADDYYELDSISTLMSVVKVEQADFVTANYYISYENKNIKVDTSSYFSKNITKEEIVSYMTLTSCSKLIKKSLFIDNNIFYPENIKRCEELNVIPIVAYNAKKPIAVDNVLYHYYQRENSASNNNKKNVELKDIEYFDITFENFCKKIKQEEYKEELEFRAIEYLMYSKILVMLKSHINDKDILQYIANFKDRYPNFMKNKYLKHFNKVKRIFIRILYYKILILAKIFVRLHEKLTG